MTCLVPGQGNYHPESRSAGVFQLGGKLTSQGASVSPELYGKEDIKAALRGMRKEAEDGPQRVLPTLLPDFVS